MSGGGRDVNGGTTRSLVPFVERRNFKRAFPIRLRKQSSRVCCIECVFSSLSGERLTTLFHVNRRRLGLFDDFIPLFARRVVNEREIFRHLRALVNCRPSKSRPLPLFSFLRSLFWQCVTRSGYRPPGSVSVPLATCALV